MINLSIKSNSSVFNLDKLFNIDLIFVGYLLPSSKNSLNDIEITAKFEGEDKVTYDAFIGSESATVTTKYKISSDKNLFLKVDNDDWKLFGKVDAYEIIINSDIFESELGNMELIMKCSSALTQKTIYIVFGCVGLIGGIICFITQFLLNKKMVATDVKIQNNNLVDGTL